MRVLGMFARKPVAGQTKTRLAESIGPELTAELYGAFLTDLLARCPDCCDRFIAAVTPDNQETHDWFRTRLRRFNEKTSILGQPEANLGGRIDWYFREAKQDIDSRVVLIGSDSPDLPNSLIQSAFDKLSAQDVVIAPASDGGFVLIGMRKWVPGIFDEIPWSSAGTLLQTMRAFRDCGIEPALIQPWYDIDYLENLGTFVALQEGKRGLVPECPATNQVIASNRKIFSRLLSGSKGN